MKKVYIINTIHTGYGGDKMIFGDFVPDIYSTYAKALKAFKELVKEFGDMYTCIDDVKHEFYTYNEQTNTFEIEPYAPDELDDDELMSNFENAPILMEVDLN